MEDDDDDDDVFDYQLLVYYDVDDEVDNKISMVYYHEANLLIHDVYDDVNEFYEDLQLLMMDYLLEQIFLFLMVLFQVMVNLQRERERKNYRLNFKFMKILLN